MSTINFIITVIICFFFSYSSYSQESALESDLRLVNNHNSQQRNLLRDVQSPGVFILQSGQENLTDVDIKDPSQLSSVIVRQGGYQNYSDINLNSYNSEFNIDQRGSKNDLSLELNDVGSKMNFTQYGSRNLIDFDINFTNNNDLSINQRGNEHELIIETRTIGIQNMTITQNGNGASLIIRE